MSKICPNCNEIFDDSHGFCSNCGSRLIDNVDVNPALNIGDANAISGGININQSKTITSHDTHYHTTTVQERSKSESELKLDATNQLRAKTEAIMAERGRIDSAAMSQLRPLAIQLGIDDETFKSIIKDVRSNRNGSSNGLSPANTRYLQQAQQAVQANDMDGLSNLNPRLESMASISQDDNVQYLYYLSVSLLDPIKSMEVYERQTDENYWRSFWAIISYIRTGKHAEAAKVLALFDPMRYEKSEDDQNLLEAYFNLMKNNKEEAKVFLDDILGEPTEQIKPLLQAIESKIYGDDTDNKEAIFYIERVLVRSEEVVKKKKIETQVEAKALTEDEAKALYDAVDTGSDPSKIKELQKLAEAGDVWAMFYYARLYTMSNSVKQNFELAVDYYTKAANAGNPNAMNNLGNCYSNGDGVNQNKVEALKWYRKGADAGNAVAMMNLANLYSNGDGINQDYAEATKWYRKAAEAGNAWTMGKLGLCYENGNGVSQDISEAVKWYRKGVEKGDAWSMKYLGVCYEYGNGVNLDFTEAAKWYHKAADRGIDWAMCQLGDFYLNGKGVIQNDYEAYKWYYKGAEAGNLTAMTNVGFCYEFGRGVEANPVEAMNWYQKALDNGFQMNEWLSKRMEECKLKLPSNVEVIFNNAWATAPNDINTDKWNIYLHLHFQINHCNNRKLYIRFTTELSNDNNDSTGIILSIIDDECIPNYDFCEWKDYIHWINEGVQNWPNNESNMRLKTTIQVMDEYKNPLTTNSYWITYNVIHKIRLFHDNELYLA